MLRTNTLAASPALIHLFPPSSPGRGLFPGRDLAFACQRGHLSLGRTPAIILCFKKLKKKKKAHKTEAGMFPEAVQSHKLGWQKNGVTFLERKRDTSAPLTLTLKIPTRRKLTTTTHRHTSTLSWDTSLLPPN